MEDYTLKIPENNSKALALLNYIKTLDFVELTKSGDWWDEVSVENKASINRGIDDIVKGNTHKDSDVRNSIRERILKAKKA